MADLVTKRQRDRDIERWRIDDSHMCKNIEVVRNHVVPSPSNPKWTVHRPFLMA